MNKLTLVWCDKGHLPGESKVALMDLNETDPFKRLYAVFETAAEAKEQVRRWHYELTHAEPISV